MILKRPTKVVGDNRPGIGRYIDEYCTCGCRLRTDLKIIWCSNPKCSYWRGVALKRPKP